MEIKDFITEMGRHGIFFTVEQNERGNLMLVHRFKTIASKRNPVPVAFEKMKNKNRCIIERISHHLETEINFVEDRLRSLTVRYILTNPEFFIPMENSLVFENEKTFISEIRLYLPKCLFE